MDALPKAIAIVPLLLIGSGLLAMLLPDRLLSSITQWRDPAALTMLPLALGLVLLGLLLAALNIGDSVRTYQSRQWQPVPAQITHSALVRTMQPRSSNPAWRADVRYHYRHDGHDYTGHRIAAHDVPSSDRAGTADWLQRTYPVGADVTAYVNPAAPAQAMLERGGSAWLPLWMAGVGLVLAGAGAWLLRTALRPTEPAPAQNKRNTASRKRKSRRRHRR